MTLPKDKHDAIIKWASENAATEQYAFDETRYIGLIDGADQYATQLHTLQQENELIKEALKAFYDFFDKEIRSDYLEARIPKFNLYRAALTAQPEGDKQTK